MRAAGVGNAGETLKAVADDRAVWIEAALGEPRDRGCTEAGDPAQLQPNRLSLGGRLDGGDERRLARRPAASPSAGAFAAEIGVVDLNPAGQPLGASRSSMTCFSLCLIFQAVVCVTPRRRPSSMLEMPCLVCVR